MAMLNAIKDFFSPPSFERDEDNLRAKFINGYAWISIFLMLIAAPPYLLRSTLNIQTIIVIVAALAIMFSAIYMLRRGQIDISGLIIIIVGWLLIGAASMTSDGIRGTEMLAYIALALLASIIISLRVGIIVIIASTVMLWVLAIMEANGYTTPNLDSGPYNLALTLSVNFAIIGVLIYISTNSLRGALERANKSEEDLRKSNEELHKLTESLEQRIEDGTRELKGRTGQLKAIADVAHSLATIQEMDKLLSQITELVSAQFGFYHVGIFLLDPSREYAILSAANSKGGQNMLARGHRLKVGEQGIVGYTTFSGNPRVALDVGDDAVYFDNPDMPETHSEVALPLKFGNEIIGALDIQSTESNAFSQEDVETFSVLADQVSVAIQNTRSLEQTQRVLHDLEIASRQATGETWQGFIETIRTRGYRYDGIKPQPLKESQKSLTEKGSTLSIPVQLRGSTIGRLNLKTLDQTKEWTDDELAIIESTAERVAIALESARLLEDAQKRASRETFLSEMASKLGKSFQLDSILRDTVEELGQTLQGSRVTFQLVNPSSPTSAESQNQNPKIGKGSE